MYDMYFRTLGGGWRHVGVAPDRKMKSLLSRWLYSEQPWAVKHCVKWVRRTV